MKLLNLKKRKAKGPNNNNTKYVTLVTRIEEVLRIAVMGGKLSHVMLPLEDMAEFMDTNMV